LRAVRSVFNDEKKLSIAALHGPGFRLAANATVRAMPA
jgi:hypothetical protein